MKIVSERKLPPKLQYNSDFSDVVTIEENKFRAIINAISITKDLKHAALELDVSKKMLGDFCGKYDIDSETRKLMRKHFKSAGTKIKLRFNHG